MKDEVQGLTTTFGTRVGVSLDWERVYEAHAPQLQRYLVKLTGDREAGTELMQDTFVRGMGADLREPAAARAWLYRTATNLALTRKRRQRLFAFIPFTGHEPSADVPFDEEADQVRRALRSLSDDQAVTLLLRYQSGFTRAEIAAMHAVSEETVKSRLSRGRKSFIAAYGRVQRGLAQ